MVKMDIIKVYQWKNLYQTEQQISWKMKIKEIGQNLDKKRTDENYEENQMTRKLNQKSLVHV